ncbi:hypothetical protein Mspyr1_41280 [Mycolicibacterium gilvum Spyr1]|uniref:Uncharacterized protein n=1 Tax=Mycolicibacterium gilvum (strain DSM 45189 / LMG 24558 / Spyr1) TaxID=278137 RepID=E6TAQ4_MYCSR|nr:hypothetical protein Mspyr1_41280 [Mycolicibacterium gilvum Spyr1]
MADFRDGQSLKLGNYVTADSCGGFHGETALARRPARAGLPP